MDWGWLFWIQCSFFSKHFEVLIYGGTKIWFSAQLVKRRDQHKHSYSNFSQAENKTRASIYGFFDTVQVTKLTWFKFLSACFRFVAWTFKMFSKNAISAVILQYFGKMYFFINTGNAILITTLCVFFALWLHYHNLLFSFTCVNIRADSE